MSSASSSSASDSEQSTAPPSHPRKRQRLSDDETSEDSGGEDDSAESDGSNNPQSDTDSGSDEEELPVLSHAEKRRHKKKEQRALKPPAADAEDGSSKKGKAKVKNTAELDPSKIPKRQNSIWVGNLSYKTTPASLKTFFEGVGEITRIHMPMKMATSRIEGQGPKKENRGFAYVDFATPDAKTTAIALSENPLDGRRLLIKDGGDFNGRPAPIAAGADGDDTSKNTGHTKTAQKILSVQKQPPGPTLFLGNLGFETTEESIRELLESHRAKEAASDDKWIRKVRLGTFEDSGKCKGWAFVDFTSAEYATAALTNPRNHHLNGRKLVVEYASPDAVRRGGGGPPRTDRKPIDKGKGGKRERPDRKDKGDVAEAGGDAGDEEQGPPVKRRRPEGADDGKPRGDRGFKGGPAGRGGKGPRPRSKPGAALALAKREDVSIVPSQGKKIVF